MSIPKSVAGHLKFRLLRPILHLLKQGMTPHKLAVTVSVGTIIGIIPAFGTTTVLGTAIAARYRLNIAATVLISYLAQPLQLLFYIPFIKAGIFMFGLSELRVSLDEMIAMFKADWLAALDMLWKANLAGVSAWLLLAFPAGMILYAMLLPLLKHLLPKQVDTTATVPIAEQVPVETPICPTADI